MRPSPNARVRFFCLAALSLTFALAGCAGANDGTPSASVHIDAAKAAATSAEPAPQELADTSTSTGAPAPRDAARTPATASPQAPPPVQTPPSPPVNANSAKAEVLFDEARKAISAGDYATACPKLEASLKLDFAVGTLMNLAVCVEHLGDKARACGLYGQAAAECHARGQADREKMALQKRSALGCTP